MVDWHLYAFRFTMLQNGKDFWMSNYQLSMLLFHAKTPVIISSYEYFYWLYEKKTSQISPLFMLHRHQGFYPVLNFTFDSCNSVLLIFLEVEVWDVFKIMNSLGVNSCAVGSVDMKVKYQTKTQRQQWVN